jgi:hypothetical protein
MMRAHHATRYLADDESLHEKSRRLRYYPSMITCHNTFGAQRIYYRGLGFRF